MYSPGDGESGARARLAFRISGEAPSIRCHIPVTNYPLDTQEGWDAATKTYLEARRDKLLRAARRQRILSRVAVGLSGIIALGIPVPLLAGDRSAARLIAVDFCIVLSFTYFAGKAGRKYIADSLRKMDQSGK
jgi:hypothetical protein